MRKHLGFVMPIVVYIGCVTDIPSRHHLRKFSKPYRTRNCLRVINVRKNAKGLTITQLPV